MSYGDGLARLRQALEDSGCTVRGTAAQCPAPDHDDRQASLSIDQGREGAVVRCHAGCATDIVLEALGMSAADLFDEPRGDDHPRHRVIAEYRYTDEHGALLFVKERRLPRDFRIRRPDGHGGWIWGLGDTRRVLYNLPAVLEATAAGQTVFLVEGEKDADAIGRAGAVATCNFSGAAKDSQRPKWRPEYGDVLKGATVIVIADKDPAGYAHAAAIEADLSGKAESVTIMEAAEGKDAADHLAAGYGLDEFRPVAADTPDGVPASRLTELRGALLDSAALDSIPRPQPVIDGLFYRDSLAWLHGKPGHGKSFIALDWAGCVSTGLPWQMHEAAQGTVLYLIAEGTPGLRQRVRAWEDYTGQTMQVKFLPIAVQLLAPNDLEAFTRLAAELDPVLIVVDTQARVTVGFEENSAKDMGMLVAAVDRVRIATRACVLLVHHEARGGENMRGSTSLEGAAASIMRASKDGAHIKLETTKQKDLAEPDPIALHLVPRLDSAVIQSTGEAGPAEDLSESQSIILTAMRESFGATGAPGGRLLEITGLKKTTFYRSLNRLASDGYLINTGTRKRPHYELPPAAGATGE